MCVCVCVYRDTPTDVFNVMGALFICITFLGTYNASGVLPVLAAERPVFYRERAAKMYDALPYALALVGGTHIQTHMHTHTHTHDVRCSAVRIGHGTMLCCVCHGPKTQARSKRHDVES